MSDMECILCGKEMGKAEWSWGEEDAHEACVRKEATGICRDCDWWGYFPGECGECGKPLKRRKPSPGKEGGAG